MKPIPIQDFDSQDQQGNPFSDYANPRPVIYAARFSQTKDADGFPQFKQVDNTLGAVGGAVYLVPGGTSRKLGQWCLGGGVPCKVTQASPLKVQPIKTASTLATDSDLSDFEVFAASGSPTVGQVGRVYQCTDLGSKQLLFFTDSSGGGGGGGAGGGFTGIDGAVSVSGGADIHTGYCTILFDGGTNYHLSGANLICESLEVPAGTTLQVRGSGIYCKTLTGSGIIDAPGVSPGGFAGGGGAVGGGGLPQGGGGAGGDGRTGIGFNGVGGGGSSAVPQTYPSSDVYGKGGAGGSGATSAGGISNPLGPCTTLQFTHFPDVTRVGSQVAGGAGGGGGGGDGSHVGGGGGGGGGVIYIECPDMSGFTGTLRAKGGNGAAGTGFVTFAGGGGGGGGGTVFTITATKSASWTVDVSGGTGGAAGGAGANPGADGNVGYSGSLTPD